MGTAFRIAVALLSLTVATRAAEPAPIVFRDTAETVRRFSARADWPSAFAIV